MVWPLTCRLWCKQSIHVYAQSGTSVVNETYYICECGCSREEGGYPSGEREALWPRVFSGEKRRVGLASQANG